MVAAASIALELLIARQIGFAVTQSELFDGIVLSIVLLRQV